MNGLRRKRLRCALVGAFAAGAGAANAVFVSPDGLGQALLYPYYTVQSAGGNSFNTYLSVVNTTQRAKAVRVRFREGKNGREVLDFNLYLSPNDVWTAALGPQDSTSTSPAMLVTADKSCTSPPIPAEGVAFRNFYYVGANADGGSTSLDRTREGYFEVIEMANLQGAAATAATHNSAGIPANCAYLQPANGFRTGAVDTQLQPPNGGLTGSFTLINVSNGLNFAGVPTALGQLFAAANFTENNTVGPDLSSADPVAQTVAPNSPGTGGLVAYTATYANGRDAVSATLMKSSVLNEYALDAATRSATDFVMTFPTRVFHVSSSSGATTAPFSATFGANGACEDISIAFFNREEGAAVVSNDFGLPFAQPKACWASQVLSPTAIPATATESSVLGSRNWFLFNNSIYANGTMLVGFTGSGAVNIGLSSVAGTGSALDMAAGRSVSPATLNHKGLPVIGFAVRTLNNGLLNCTTFGGSAGTCVGSYGLLTDHRYVVTTSPTP